MNRKRQLGDIGALYGDVLDKALKTANLLTEKKHTPANIPKDTFKVVGKNQKPNKGKPFVGKKSGPEGVDGLAPIPPQSKENEKFSVKTEKVKTPQINISMNKFDTLYKQVISGKVRLNEADGTLDDVSPADVADMPEGDVDALGASDMPGNDLPAEEPKTPAEHLKAAIEHLNMALDELEGESVEGGEEPAEGADELPDVDETPEDEKVAGEATEMKEVKDSDGQKLTKTGSGSNKVPGNASNVKGGKTGDAKAATKVGKDEELGTPLVNQKKSSLSDKNNKVDGHAKPGLQIGH